MFLLFNLGKLARFDSEDEGATAVDSPLMKISIA